MQLDLSLPADTYLPVDTEHPVITLSPDGTHVAFVGSHHGVRRLYIRALNESAARVIERTEGAASPFFSPDGTWIGFFRGSSLIKVRAAGGVPIAARALTPITVNRGAVFAPDDTVVFAGSANSGLARASIAGEERRTLDDWEWLTRKDAPYAWPFLGRKH